MSNILKETIEDVLRDVHIETGRADKWDMVVYDLEYAISRKICAHEIDFYSESEKIWNRRGGVMGEFITVKKGDDITRLMDMNKVTKGSGTLKIICEKKSLARTRQDGGIEIRPFEFNKEAGDPVIRVDGVVDGAEGWIIPGFTITHMADGSLITQIRGN